MRCSNSNGNGNSASGGSAPNTSSGGSSPLGGSASGGVTGGSSGASQGGATGGTASGGISSGGVASGGISSGGAASGGAASGRTASGGMVSGGNGGGGAPSGGGGAANGGNGGSKAGGGGASTADSCAGKQYLLCESFETTADGAIPTGWSKSGTVAVASDQAARGQHSLKVGNAESGERRIRHSATSFGNNHWGRLFYRVQLPAPTVNPSKNGGNTVIHSTLVGLNADRPSGGGTAEYRVLDTIMNTSKKHNYIYNVQTSNAGEFGHETAYTYDYKDSWVCAEWHVDNAAKNYSLYIDGAEITGVAVANDQPRGEIPASFLELRLGWYNYQAGDGGFTAWIDEVAVNTTRIGCDN
jgi:hypothetical protein